MCNSYLSSALGRSNRGITEVKCALCKLVSWKGATGKWGQTLDRKLNQSVTVMAIWQQLTYSTSWLKLHPYFHLKTKIYSYICFVKGWSVTSKKLRWLRFNRDLTSTEFINNSSTIKILFKETMWKKFCCLDSWNSWNAPELLLWMISYLVWFWAAEMLLTWSEPPPSG